MTAELPDDLLARTDQAMACYFAVHKATWDGREDLNNWCDKRDAAEASLIHILAEIWEEWKKASPRSRVRDKQYPYGERYPFAEWVHIVFKDSDLFEDSFRPPPAGRIREILKRKTES